MYPSNKQGIDYAGFMSTVNRNSETGIRYGVISTHALHEWFYEAQEMDYGDATCPECGNKVIDSCLESIADKEWNTGKDYACEQCEQCYWSDSVYPDEAQGWHIDDGEYKVIDCLDSDAMVIESPYFTYAHFCSPCAPGACSMDSPVDPADIDDTTAKCYCFSHDWFDGGRAPYPVYSVDTGEQIMPTDLTRDGEIINAELVTEAHLQAIKFAEIMRAKGKVQQ